MWKVAFMASVAATHTMAAELPTHKVKSPRVQGLDSFANSFGQNLANLNMGMMKSMMNDPDGTSNACYEATVATGDALIKMTDFAAYITGGFDIGTFGETLKIAQINFIAQTSACDYNKFLIAGDMFLNKIPNVSAGAANLVT